MAFASSAKGLPRKLYVIPSLLFCALCKPEADYSSIGEYGFAAALQRRVEPRFCLAAV